MAPVAFAVRGPIKDGTKKIVNIGGFGMFALLSLIVLWVPAYTVLDYLVLAFGAVTFVNVTSNVHRLITVALIVVIWSLSSGFVAPPNTASTSNASAKK